MLSAICERSLNDDNCVGWCVRCWGGCWKDISPKLFPRKITGFAQLQTVTCGDSKRTWFSRSRIHATDKKSIVASRRLWRWCHCWRDRPLFPRRSSTSILAVCIVHSCNEATRGCNHDATRIVSILGYTSNSKAWSDHADTCWISLLSNRYHTRWLITWFSEMFQYFQSSINVMSIGSSTLRALILNYFILNLKFHWLESVWVDCFDPLKIETLVSMSIANISCATPQLLGAPTIKILQL